MAAANDLVVIGDVNTFLGETTSNNAAVLGALITGVSTMVQTYCDDPFLTTTYDMIFSGWNSTSAPVPYGPLTDVNFVNVDGMSVPACPANNAAVYPQYGYSWNADEQLVRLSGCRFTRGDNNCEINYTAGYANQAAVPLDLQYAVWKLVGLAFKGRTRLGKGSESLGGRMTAAYLESWPDDVKLILNLYKRRARG